MKKKNRNGIANKSLKEYISLVYVLLIIVACCYTFMNAYVRRSSIKNNPKSVTKALIINEKAYDGNSPVSKSFTYKYKFEVNGKQYFGTSFNSRFTPGDTIEIEFVVDKPEYNAPKGYYD